MEPPVWGRVHLTYGRVWDERRRARARRRLQKITRWRPTRDSASHRAGRTPLWWTPLRTAASWRLTSKLEVLRRSSAPEQTDQVEHLLEDEVLQSKRHL